MKEEYNRFIHFNKEMKDAISGFGAKLSVEDESVVIKIPMGHFSDAKPLFDRLIKIEEEYWEHKNK